MFGTSGIHADSMGHCHINTLQFMCSRHVVYFTHRIVTSNAGTVCRSWKTPRRAAVRTLYATGTATSGADVYPVLYLLVVSYYFQRLERVSVLDLELEI